MATRKKKTAAAQDTTPQDEIPGTPSFLNSQSGHVAQTISDSYPHLQWFNGQKALRKLGGVSAFGGYVFKFDQDPDWPLGELIEYDFSDGTTGQIFDIGGAAISILATRVDWYIGKRDDKVWLPKYEKGAKGRNRFLVFVQGAEDWHIKNGPLQLTQYGVNGVLMNREVVGAYARIRSKAGAILGQRLDDYTFYMPVEPGPSQQASPNFPSLITPPTLVFDANSGDPDVVAAYAKHYRQEDAELIASLNQLYIGDAMMVLASSLWDEAQEWANRPMDAVAPTETDDAKHGDKGKGFGSSGSVYDDGPPEDAPEYPDEEYEEVF